MKFNKKSTTSRISLQFWKKWRKR